MKIDDKYWVDMEMQEREFVQVLATAVMIYTVTCAKFGKPILHVSVAIKLLRWFADYLEKKEKEREKKDE